MESMCAWIEEKNTLTLKTKKLQAFLLLASSNTYLHHCQHWLDQNMKEVVAWSEHEREELPKLIIDYHMQHNQLYIYFFVGNRLSYIKKLIICWFFICNQLSMHI